jgi:hypothetical protein
VSDEVQRRITIGQGINLAATIAASVAVQDGDPAPVLANVAAIASDCIDICFQLHAEGVVKHALPGTVAVAAPVPPAQQSEPFPLQQYKPAPQGGFTPGPAPAQIPGATSGGGSKKDAQWQAYFASPGDYYDNRQNKKNPASPDFKHRTTGEALWLGGRYPAPAWVLARLGVAA